MAGKKTAKKVVKRTAKKVSKRVHPTQLVDVGNGVQVAVPRAPSSK